MQQIKKRDNAEMYGAKPARGTLPPHTPQSPLPHHAINEGLLMGLFRRNADGAAQKCYGVVNFLFI
jgi:hypothetical protein